MRPHRDDVAGRNNAFDDIGVGRPEGEFGLWEEALRMRSGDHSQRSVVGVVVVQVQPKSEEAVENRTRWAAVVLAVLD